MATSGFETTQEKLTVGVDLIKAGRFKEASVQLAQVLEEEHGNSMIHNYLGEAYLGLMQSDRAKVEYRKSVRLDPYSVAGKHAKTRLAYLTGENRDQEPTAGSVWIEPVSGMEFVWVPSGCFVMGAEDGETDERPRHVVCVDGFYISRYEVTQDQYSRITGTNPSKFQGHKLPVDSVTWYDAKNFASELADRSGITMRLPTEAEWEYACRGGQQNALCGDDDIESLGWFSSNSGKHTHLVGQKRPNPWGIYDMGGNVWEWVEDCYHKSYEGAPSDGSAWTVGGDCSLHVKRGGSWYHIAAGTRSANRSWRGASLRRSKIGFRVAMVRP
jgi:formylglycine-generating enzyme required for sulfatase activity